MKTFEIDKILSLAFHIIKFGRVALPARIKNEIKGIRYTNKINICCLLSTPTIRRNAKATEKVEKFWGRWEYRTYCERVNIIFFFFIYKS